MRRVFLVLVLGVAIGGCGKGGPSGELERAAARWADAGISDYTLTVSLSCFCPRERIGPFQVAVSDGQVVEIRFDGQVIEPTRLTPVEVFTVEGLFAEIRANQSADRLTVEYSDRGVPTRIDIDQIEEAVDDEVTITASITVP